MVHRIVQCRMRYDRNDVVIFARIETASVSAGDWVTDWVIMQQLQAISETMTAFDICARNVVANQLSVGVLLSGGEWVIGAGTRCLCNLCAGLGAGWVVPHLDQWRPAGPCNFFCCCVNILRTNQSMRTEHSSEQNFLSFTSAVFKWDCVPWEGRCSPTGVIVPGRNPFVMIQTWATAHVLVPCFSTSRRVASCVTAKIVVALIGCVVLDSMTDPECQVACQLECLKRSLCRISEVR